MELLSASPAFKQGDLILAEDPFVFTVSSNQVETRCHNCLAWLAQEEDEEIPARSRCSACRYSRYCSKKCQVRSYRYLEMTGWGNVFMCSIGRNRTGRSAIKQSARRWRDWLRLDFVRRIISYLC